MPGRRRRLPAACGAVVTSRQNLCKWPVVGGYLVTGHCRRAESRGTIFKACAARDMAQEVWGLVMLFRGLKAVLLACGGVGALIATTADANAGGFAVREQSAYGQGSSFAGVAAGGSLSSMFWNPATMTQVPGLQSEFGADRHHAVFREHARRRAAFASRLGRHRQYRQGRVGAGRLLFLAVQAGHVARPVGQRRRSACR